MDKKLIWVVVLILALVAVVLLVSKAPQEEKVEEKAVEVPAPSAPVPLVTKEICIDGIDKRVAACSRIEDPSKCRDWGEKAKANC